MNSPDRCEGQKVTETPQEAPEQCHPENTSFPPDSQMISLEEQASALALASRAIQNEERTEEAPGFVRVRGAVVQVKNGIPGTDLQERQYHMGYPNKAGPEAFATSILAKDGEDRRTLRDKRRNALMSIAHLPPEVLNLVFHHVVEDRQGDIPELLHALLLVSKTWKTLVEGNPSLWCRIALSRSRAGPGYLTTALEGSQNLLLTIDYHYKFTVAIKPEFLLREICKHMHRWKSVRLVLDGTTEDFGLLDRPPPEHLERFQCSTITQRSVYLPLFGGHHPPNLRDVRLEGFTVDWDSSNLRNLKFLHISGIYPLGVPSASQLLRILQQCPDLEHLRLQFADFSPIEPPSDHDLPSVLQLERLKSLFLWIDYTPTFEILTNIRMPACRSLYVRTSLGSERWPTFASEALQPHSPIIHSISEAASEIQVVWKDRLVEVSMTSKSGDGAGMMLGFGGVPHREKEVLGWLAENVGLETVTVPVKLKLGLSPRNNGITDMLSRSRGVTSLELSGASQWQRQLISWLGTPLTEEEEDGNALFPLPRLEVLEGVDGAIGGAIVRMLQSRHGLIHLASRAGVQLPSPLKTIQVLDGDVFNLDRSYYRQLEEAMGGGEVSVGTRPVGVVPSLAYYAS